jgi:hypothetical protein
MPIHKRDDVRLEREPTQKATSQTQLNLSGQYISTTRNNIRAHKKRTSRRIDHSGPPLSALLLSLAAAEIREILR